MDDVRLILEVEKRPVVYDTRDLFYKDNARKDKAWREIGDIIGVDADTCRAKWRGLRDCFVKNRKRCLALGPTASVQKDWKYGEIMSFLLPYVSIRRKKESLAPGSEENGGAETPKPMPEDISLAATPEITGATQSSTLSLPGDTPRGSRDSHQPPLTVRPRDPSPQARPPKRSKTNNTDVMDRLMSLLQEPQSKPYIPATTQDESYHFALSLVPLLSRLTDDNREQAKLQMLTLLHNFTKAQEANNSIQIVDWQGINSFSQIPVPLSSHPTPIIPGTSNATQTNTFQVQCQTNSKQETFSEDRCPVPVALKRAFKQEMGEMDVIRITGEGRDDDGTVEDMNGHTRQDVSTIVVEKEEQEEETDDSGG